MINLINKIQKEVIQFTQEMIKIPSFTGEEGELAKVILKKLKEFDVDEALIDGIGNVVGVIHGKQKGIINVYDNPKGVVLTPLFLLHDLKDPITKKPHLAAF